MCVYKDGGIWATIFGMLVIFMPTYDGRKLIAFVCCPPVNSEPWWIIHIIISEEKPDQQQSQMMGIKHEEEEEQKKKRKVKRTKLCSSHVECVQLVRIG